MLSWTSEVVLVISIFYLNVSADDPWTWQCKDSYCLKVRSTPPQPAVSLPACQLTCSKFGPLWPQPTGQVVIGKALVPVNYNSIDVLEGRSETPVGELTRSAGKNLIKNIEKIGSSNALNSGGQSLVVTMNIVDQDAVRLTLNTDEGYTLRVSESVDRRINATISAQTFFGAVRGLETLGQLIIYDDLLDQLRMPNEAFITDRPVYPYRGVLLDTARNYISVDAIKRTIDGISASKLNTLHWHITDSQSFPFVSKSRPELSKLGAYSQRHVYTPKDIADVIEFGRARGVRVMPEFDAPAHVGEGWQDTDFVACFNKQPWQTYCVEPPCGQFDPTKPKLYDYLEDIYSDLIDQFDPDIFHMGGDEVSFSCWNSTPSIVNWMQTRGWGRREEDFVKLWDLFQTQAMERLDRRSKQKLPVVMWTSTLTKKQFLQKYLPKDRYIIQIWTTGQDRQVRDLLEGGYKLIMSNYDALYLDCGFAGWVQEGVNWCAPYIGWQKVYNNSLARIAGSLKSQFLGAEAALWTEQADDASLDSRIWPRAAAMAENLWAEPEDGWREAEPRILLHRQRLVNRGIAADTLEPQWCLQNQENCPVGGHFNQG